MRLGILKEIIQMALTSIKTHKLRSFLTLLGIMIGVMTVIGMVSVIQGLNRSVMGELESIGSDLIFVGKHEPIQVGHRERRRKDLTFDDALAIERECSLVKAVAVDLVADFWESIPIKYKNIKSLDSMILGMNEKFPQVLTVYLPEEGRFLIESDIIHSTKVCVLGSDMKETLFPHTNALGK
ncbi:MAG: ABC transporter permease, partial [Planctomycetota bacterium]